LDAEVEVLVLRHELAVLRRQIARPKLRRRDKLFLAAASRLLTRERWTSLLVSPQTLLRWHRELARRKWTFAHRRGPREEAPATGVRCLLTLWSSGTRIAGPLPRGKGLFQASSLVTVPAPTVRLPSRMAKPRCSGS